ncbi:Rne/Rng family ribonuclease [Nocardioides sp. cx-173]|uniref:Rne/Rng family ribonuclease n=1 Tax=Nocardioides sp. cx-173 TaxID=2898796 RepID=UPI001E2E899D|nr:Rne/Rng family ribonuclease [Nocardioides sp. cx-173]MCD4524453.1 Rne/Rng family ribonuclease [Nocardioides sp. cx-173]UGB43061.1 Rne/Rng family ribonuclease [Nocardioides sp. cx-173]
MADDTTTPDASDSADSAEGAAAPDAAAPVKKAAKRAPAKRAAAKRTTKKAAEAPAETPDTPSDAPEGDGTEAAPAKKTAAKRTAKKAPAKRAAAKKTSAAPVDVESVEAPAEPPAAEAPSSDAAAAPMVLFQTPAATKVTTRTRGRRAAAKTVEAPPEDEAAPAAESAQEPQLEVPAEAGEPARKRTPRKRAAKKTAAAPQDDEVTEVPAAPETPEAEEADAAVVSSEDSEGTDSTEDPDGTDSTEDTDDAEGGGPRRRRRRGGRRRRKAGDGDDSTDSADSQDGGDDAGAKQGKGAGRGSAQESDDDAGEGGTRRRRRRRREGDDGGNGGDDPSNTVTRVRKARSAEDEITAIAGSTRLEAKKQRRREGREAGRRRAPIVSEAEFLARREAVDRVMVIRQREELTQIAVLEDKVLVEHYVARESQTSLIGNVYLGRVQNVLPSMEAAFIDIGKGRNAVLYAGEVNWSALGHKDGQPRKIESVLTSGQSILVQVTKDPMGHKGARLTSQVSLAGRFLVYVPDGTTSGISRKLPDTERNRLKTLLKEIVPDTAGVIVRTAAEGASEEELTRDVERLKARWEDIEGKSKGQAPQLLYGEPDLTLKVVRDLFTEDFSKLVIQGEDAWNSVQSYVSHIAPDLTDRVERYDADGDADRPDVFAAYRVDEQIAKGLDRKVWLPSGGSLVIDRTEAMTVVDVNTGKFTGSGGNLEETVTKNNLEAAEEIVRQLRLRDIGGIIVVDFIDMVLESNRDLVLRRMVECLGRDRTRHQVAEVTSLGLVQMTRKRIGTGLLEAFSETCEHCQGRGLILHDQPVEARRQDDAPRGGSGTGGGGRRTRGGRGRDRDEQVAPAPKAAPSPKDIAAMAKPENAARVDVDALADEPETPPVEGEVAEVVTATEVEAVVEPVVEPVVETDTAPQAEEAADPAASAEPEPEPAQPEAPRVVTRTRRTTRSTATISTTPAEMPVVVPAAESAAPVEVVSAPEPPKVVTRSRGRSRAAKPAEEAPTDVVADVDAGEDADSGPAVEHVPVKKRTRKR